MSGSNAKLKDKSVSVNKETCMTEGCEEPVFACGLCTACYQWDYYWTRKKNAGERREYVKRVERITNRVESLQIPQKPRIVK